MKTDAAPARWHFRFFGRVQGVGFRFTAGHLARSLNLTGWVKNEYDGSVSMEIQGNPTDIKRFLVALEHQRFIQIDYIEKNALDPIEEHCFRTEY